MDAKRTMVAVALLVGTGCGVAPEGADEPTVTESTTEATAQTRGALTARATSTTDSLAVSDATSTTTKVLPQKGIDLTKLPTITFSPIVGTGSPASCTEAALTSALASGSPVTFNCGAAPAVITITSPKVISGTVSVDGGSTVTLTGNFQTRIFEVTTTGTLNLAHITLDRGVSATGNGGAIANHGYLNLNDVTVQTSVAPAGSGGAIFTDGRNTKIDNSRFISNSGGESGGAIAMLNGVAAAGIQIGTSRFENNTAQGANTGFGGAIWAGGGCLVVRDSVFASNRGMEGGAIFASPGVVLTVLGTPATPISASAMQFNGNSAVFDGGAIINQGTASISNSVFQSNQVPKNSTGIGFGGAVMNLGGSANVSGSFFFKNEGRFGGAFFSGDAANTFVDKSAFVQNSSGSLGGAMYMNKVDTSVTVTNSAFETNTSDIGGGLARNDARLRIESSSFTGNTARVGGGMMIATLPGSSMNPYVRVQNVTVFGNAASQVGGGVHNSGAGIEMYSMTIVGNTGGGVFTEASGNSRFRDTVLQNAGFSNCGLAGGSYSDDAANFATDSTCLLSSQSRSGTNLNPMLGSLTRDPNGLTSFLKAAPLSPLLDRGFSCPTLDQIGASRIGACDIGAVESGTSPVINTGVLTGAGTVVLASP